MTGPTITNDYPFLFIDEEAMIIYLRPKTMHEPGLYSEAKISFDMDESTSLTLDIVIEATIIRCVLDSIGFQIRESIREYYIWD